MIVFLLIGSGEVQPWAIRRPADAIISEEIPLAGCHYFSNRIASNRYFVLDPSYISVPKISNKL
jgi:hypothetical protein